MANVTRRSFVAGAAAAGATVALAGNAVSALADAAPSYTPGTYTAAAAGVGTVTVTVTFSEDAITDVQIDAANETPDVGGAITGILANAVIDAQGPVIDTIGGATVTSRAVQEAVANCIAQATEGAAPSEVSWIDPIPPVEAPEAWDYETDIVCVGSNIGGMVAAARLSQNGRNCIVLERNSEDYLVGDGRRAIEWMAFGGSKFFDEETYGPNYGYFKTPYSDQDVYNYWMENSNYTVDPVLLRNMVICNREVVDWLIDNGADLAPVIFNFPEHKETWWLQWNVTDPTAIGQGTGIEFGEMCQHIMEANGSQMMFHTKVTALVMEDGRCTGVQAVTHDMQTIYVKGNEAVILSGCNFQSNKQMMEKYTGIGANIKMGMTGGNGNVIRMAQGAGADMAGIGCTGGTSDNLAVLNHASDMLPRCKYYGYVNGPCRYPWLQINKQGERVGFVTFTEYMEQTGRPVGDVLECWSRTATQQLAHGETFSFFDANWEQYAIAMDETDIAGHGFQRKGMFQGAAELNPKVNPREWVDDSIERIWQEALDDGTYKVADTIEELAEKMGFDPEVLQEAIDKWNAICEAGVDDPVYHFNPVWLNPIKEPPFYGVQVTAAVYSTWCGVKVTPSNQVVATDGHAIDGLYATFHVAGGLAGSGNPKRGIGDQLGAMLESGYNISKALLDEEYVMI